MTFKDYFSQTASDYARYRPHYPKPLFAYLSELAPDRKIAWDCATGNGQVAYELAAYFKQVYASDASEQQIQHARQHERIQYLIAIAESTPLADQSLDLITVAQAFHWFNPEAFYQEVQRVLKPNGIIALWCYGFCQIPDASDSLNNALQQFYDTIDPFWSPERLLVTSQYQTISFPFPEITPPPFAMTQDWTADQLIGYLTTWSSVQTYRKLHGDAHLSFLLNAIAENYPATSLSV
ncbi:MAG: class I SAM-dependent methyltransferase, partial [Microcystaceae cyanobacterium]